MKEFDDYVDDNGKIIATGEALTDLRDIYNINGIALMDYYEVNKLQVIKPGVAESSTRCDRVTIRADLNNNIYAIEKILGKVNR